MPKRHQNKRLYSHLQISLTSSSFKQKDLTQKRHWNSVKKFVQSTWKQKGYSTIDSQIKQESTQLSV